MKIVSADLYALRIPFTIPFSHRLKTRSFSDSIIVKLTTDSGESGFGEGVARPYVTGETVSSSLDYIKHVLLPLIQQHVFHPLPQDTDSMNVLSEISAMLPMLPDTGKDSVIAFNASKAAIEIALIDALLKHSGKSLSYLIQPHRESVTYSAVITADSEDKIKKIARECGQYGMKQVKIKVGVGDDYRRIATVRDIVGNVVSLRVDANCAFDIKGALDLIASIQSLGIDSIEQPVPRGDINALAQVKKDSIIPIMVDESLITEADAVELIEKNACDLFNLRISKNGGLFRTLRLAELARKAGIGFQLGCHVGETAILSAAGRHLAAHLDDVKFIEGSYGTLLLEEDIAVESVQFGYAGNAPLLKGPGLGIQVRQDLLEKYAEKTINITLE